MGHPEDPVFNQLCNVQWNTPVGKANACGGDALICVEARAAVSGHDLSFIARENLSFAQRFGKSGRLTKR